MGTYGQGLSLLAVLCWHSLVLPFSSSAGKGAVIFRCTFYSSVWIRMAAMVRLLSAIATCVVCDRLAGIGPFSTGPSGDHDGAEYPA